MSHPKDRTGALLRKCLKRLKDYHAIACGGDWGEAEALASLIKEVEKAILYREVGPTHGN